MYAIYAYIDPQNHPNVGRYGIHGVSGYGFIVIYAYNIQHRRPTGHQLKPATGPNTHPTLHATETCWVWCWIEVLENGVNVYRKSYASPKPVVLVSLV